MTIFKAYEKDGHVLEQLAFICHPQYVGKDIPPHHVHTL